MSEDTAPSASPAAGDRLVRWIPELLRAAAAAPEDARALWTERFDRTELRVGPRPRAAIRLRLAALHECERCAELRAAEALRAGLSEDEIRLARRGRSDDEREQALLALATKLVRQKGHHVRLVLDAARGRGVTEQELTEVLALVALQTFLDGLGELAPEPRAAHDDDPVRALR